MKKISSNDTITTYSSCYRTNCIFYDDTMLTNCICDDASFIACAQDYFLSHFTLHDDIVHLLNKYGSSDYAIGEDVKIKIFSSRYDSCIRGQL